VEEATDFGYFAFTVPVVGRRTYVAYCYPYTTADLEVLLQPLSRSRFELCRSPEDRPVPYVRLGNHQSPKRSVWILARQHAGETPSSYVAEGIIRTLSAAGEPDADTAFHVIPMLDVDGVFHGRYGKDQEPVDFNRDWREHPVRPEITALQRAIRASHEQAPISLFIDLHAPHHGDTSCYAFSAPETRGNGGELLGRFRRSLEEAGPQTVGFRAADVRTDYRPERSARDYLERSLGIPVITFELSYHLSQTGRYLTQGDYRDFGSAVVKSLAEALL
jgi:predicted deacylase